MKNSDFIFIEELVNIPIIKKYSFLSQAEYPKNNPITLEKHLRWKYLNNPEGLSFAINGYYKDKLIARISYQKKKFIFKNEIIKGANLCDLLIHKNFRKLDNLLQLTNQFFVKKDIPGSNVSIMLPNEISINIYKKILNLKPIGHLELRVIPIIHSIIHKKLKFKIPNFLDVLLYKFLLFILKILKFLSKTNFSSNEVENEAYEKMIRTYYKDNLIQGERSKDWINWRYSSSSSINYFLEYIYIGDNLVGYFAYRKAEKNGYDILLLMDIIVIKKNFFIELTILLKLLSIAIKKKYDLILSLRTFQKTNPLSNLLFPKIPKFLLPTPLELFIVTNQRHSSQIFDINKWKINMADLDIF